MLPDLRITIRRDGIVRAVLWSPNLEICGPISTLLDARERAGVTLADVEMVRDDEDGPVTEALVEFLCGGDDAARDALTEWAALVGMRRLWLPGEIRDLEPVATGKFETTCSSCRVRLVDGTSAFWAWVTRMGHFPAGCPLCGGDLPQWRPVVPRRAPRTRLELVEHASDLQVSDRRAG